MPGLSVRHKGERFSIAARPELAIGDRTPWCIRVAGAWYRVTVDAGEASDAASRYLLDRIRSSSTPRRPFYLSSRRYPLLFRLKTVAIAAWPQHVPRGKGATTYINPATGERVATVKQDPWWWFESAGRDPSPCGSAFGEQSLANVVDQAKLWLRSQA